MTVMCMLRMCQAHAGLTCAGKGHGSVPIRVLLQHAEQLPRKVARDQPLILQYPVPQRASVEHPPGGVRRGHQAAKLRPPVGQAAVVNGGLRY